MQNAQTVFKGPISNILLTQQATNSVASDPMRRRAPSALAATLPAIPRVVSLIQKQPEDTVCRTQSTPVDLL